MQRIKTVAVALALAAGLSAAGPFASAESTGTAGCNTWQYRVNYHAVPVVNDYGRVDFYAHESYRFNITSILKVDDRYQGNVYRTNGDYRGRGWIDTDYLDYLRCW